jgi:hypothetical protein
MAQYNIERSPEFVDLTTRKAWTVADVRRILPDVPCLAPGGIAKHGRITGRCNDYASVTISGPCADTTGEFAWSTIAASLNNNRALRF